MTIGERICPNFLSCGGHRRQGEIFCHKCYFRLPKELREQLYAKSAVSLSRTINEGMAFLRLDQA